MFERRDEDSIRFKRLFTNKQFVPHRPPLKETATVKSSQSLFGPNNSIKGALKKITWTADGRGPGYGQFRARSLV